MEDIVTIKTALKHALECLGIERLDAEVLLSHVLGKDRAWILTHLSDNISHKEYLGFIECCRQRASGIPLAYITGHKEFYGLDFIVTTSVLIPRPETELLVETCISILSTDEFTSIAEPHVLDIGTGSGNIAVTLAVFVPKARVYAIDISEDALFVAKENAKRHGVLNRVTFIQSDLFNRLPEGLHFDVIISNPPYVDINLMGRLQRELSHEPSIALYADEGGLSIIKKILLSAYRYLKSKGYLICEIGHDQASNLMEVLRMLGVYKDVVILKDLAGHDRAILCRVY